jgi:L-alanine-DL-glutamate epimerase-like enolase superfamily enzyme
MKLTNVDVFLSGAGWRNFLFVKLTTDAGIVGWGEATLGWKETAVRETFEDYDVPWRCELTPETPRVKDGFYEVPSGPGWGVEVDESALRKHPEDPDAKLNMFSAHWEQQMCK